MAKYGELWDDSALVKAFDDAISKYKIMHGKGGDEDLLKEEKITKGTEENAPIIMNGSNEVKSANVETDNKTTDMTKNITHTREATDSSVAEKCSSEVIDKCTPPSIVVQVDAESAEAYKRLLDQYNAVEEQRQKLLEQFSQYGNWDYQGYGYGYDYGAAYDSQYHPVPAPQPSGPPICSCRPYVCPYSTAPCTSLAAASSCETCVGSTALAHSGSPAPLEDGGFIKAAMRAVDQAIHSFNTQTSGIPEVDKEGKKGQEVETGSTNVAQDRTSQTDLSVVLNAWFSAGFHTGKYLSEQRKPAVSTSSPLTTREEIERVPSKENSTDSSFKEIPKGK
ncbi:uncharacterized protein LOC112501741 isoform X1 [Cynara cardunculus var. scolymus]|uniref:Survival Motor Neuron Gemin2-binding domain-containing protein n=1 Tax=Cynara cardunculus var. scolymus TaxID=59895 RepID=A0A103XDH1_CYNCS|nr:uncharacterized protein LOC112501741 isoform X1 [Cynara cardunculus var. scolymus]KVH88748.1 hypothetical protein Ccrd_025861 [Cynara cardunculus var. scolymus]